MDEQVWEAAVEFFEALEDELDRDNKNNKGVTRAGGFKKKKVIIYFIGGITYAEMEAIRFLQLTNPSYKFIIATTSIINGETALA